MSRFGSFIKYNNAIPIALGFLFLSFGGALAASPDVRDAIYSSDTAVRSIDNTYIANKDLGNYTPTVRIASVTEDTDNYYVNYTLATIDVVDYVWRDIAKDRTMTVAKALIKGRDLGLYVTEQLSQVIDHEVAYLKEVQGIERKQVTQKVVATQYSGLVGALLSDSTTVIPGYTPIVVPPPAPVAEPAPEGATPAPAPESASGAVAGDSTSTTVPSSGSTIAADVSDQTPPTVQILGNNPARVLVGATYNDLGAAVTDNVNSNLGYRLTVDGKAVTEVQIDTQQEGTHTVRYAATDQAGNSAFAERIVEVYLDPSAPRPQTGTPDPAPASSTASTTGQ